MSTSLIFPDNFKVGGFLNGTADSFARLRVSQPTMLWEGTNLLEKDDLKWSEFSSGTGTILYNNDLGTVDLNPGTTNGNRVIFQSRSYMFYQPGFSQLINCSVILGDGQNQTRQRVGYFDDNNGLFFQQIGATKSVVRRSNTSGTPVDVVVNQDDWNIDKLDGTGDSEIVIDWSKTQLFLIDFAWLGTGIARFGFNISGTIIFCHQFNNANNLNTPWVRTPSLPVRFESTVISSGASAANLSVICASVITEGGINPFGKIFSADAGTSETSITAGDETGIIAIRARETFARAPWNLLNFSSLATSLDKYIARIYFAPQVTGGTWNVISNSKLEVNTTFSSFSSGFVLLSSYGVEEGIPSVVLNTEFSTLIQPGSSVDGATRDIILLSITALSTGTFTGGLTWKEFV